MSLVKTYWGDARLPLCRCASPSAVAPLLTVQLSEHAKEQLTILFNLLDTNKDGELVCGGAVWQGGEGESRVWGLL